MSYNENQSSPEAIRAIMAATTLPYKPFNMVIIF